jgi:hypothetical protein
VLVSECDIPQDSPSNFEPQARPVAGVVKSYQAVETCYLNVSPPGQLEVTVYVKDADLG